MNLQIVNDQVMMSLPNGEISVTTASVEQVMQMADYVRVKWYQFWRKRQTVIVIHKSEIVKFKI
ncbi:hypothetical protein AsFcp4_262 [Aeromonas phage AsFcp_4]|uniref:Uncharacterized protein n=1 Tax=Aeromonas phage PX29 TaxID=926067 RepID=E5DQ39_9CAUD|nr:hypothetical protein CL89_gp106 [Aeromonas phage PX29]ADQ52825.1 conserved hypothetical protein [Aeromonas phage PX29]QAX98371.1 hypothetical protein ASfcp2_25 [Aeromonas phage AsFcp_2]QAX99714.1 hypothetical protein AsFcp4_262 [Aeromonas phage AsFcp_4]